MKKLLKTWPYLVVAVAIFATAGLVYQVMQLKQEAAASKNSNADLQKQIDTLNSQDPRAQNKQLEDLMTQMQSTFKKAITVYQNLVDVKLVSKNTSQFDVDYAAAINLIANTNYASGSAKLDKLNSDIAAEQQKAEAALIPTSVPVPVNNTPPGGGYSLQSVQTDVGTFAVNIVSADLSTTRVIVDTASDSDCGNNCPVLPLAAYVTRSGAYAGVNGSYFCPATYPTCAGKTNSFDLLVMNKNKYYFNSDNNVYSNNPAVIFGSGYIRFVGAASEWGRDTSVDGVLSNYPLLIRGGSIAFGGNDDPKMTSATTRSFVAHRGNTVYIGDVHGASVIQVAHVMKALGMDDALNLDDGGSAALWSGGYKVGPGRDLPNVILFVKK